MDSLGKKLGFKDMKDWYSISLKSLLEYGGNTLLANYDGFPSKLVTSAYPLHSWDISEFKKVDGNVKQFMDWLGTELGFKHLDDWYKVTQRNITENKGNVFYREYSPYKLLLSAYPEHKWNKWKFKGIPIWREEFQLGEEKEFIEWLTKELKIDSLDEWYRISGTQLSEKIPSEFFLKQPLDKLLQQAHPDHKWNLLKLQTKSKLGPSKSSQRVLAKTVQEIFSKSG
jgi:hypothetical protein